MAKLVLNYLSRLVLMTIQKAFVRPRLDYHDVTYNEDCSETFDQLLKNRQKKLYQELCLEFL